MKGAKILNYQITDLIGEGGMGIVYLAVHEKLDRKVSVKVLNPLLARDEEIRNRFLQEAKTLSRLNHQNIVTLYDFADIDGNLYLIMEYIEGSNLNTLISKAEYYNNTGRIIKIFKQILDGFSYAHSRGVIHRDIKPSNIILKSDDTPKILDFGIAKILETDKRLTKTGTRMGSVMYMSPEQVLGKEVDTRSDIYSLGVTFYEMVTGKLLYDTESDSEYSIQSKIVNEPLPSVEKQFIGIGESIDYLINKATLKDSEQRYQSCGEFSSDIDRVFSNKVKTIYQPSRITEKQISKTRIIEPSEKKSKTGIYLIIASAIILLVFVVILVLILSQSKEDDSFRITASERTEKVEKKETKESKVDESAERQKVENTVYEIINAWQRKDIQGFFSHLTSDYFYQSVEGLTRTYSERKSKAYEIFMANQFINISISNLKIDINGDEAIAKYYQEYRSTVVNENTTKKLFFRKQGGKWMLYKELSGYN